MSIPQKIESGETHLGLTAEVVCQPFSIKNLTEDDPLSEGVHSITQEEELPEYAEGYLIRHYYNHDQLSYCYIRAKKFGNTVISENTNNRFILGPSKKGILAGIFELVHFSGKTSDVCKKCSIRMSVSK